MCGWLGVSRRRSRSRWIALVGCAALGLACTGESLLVGEERPTSDRVADDAVLDGGVDAHAPEVVLQGCPPSPAERQATSGCWPTRHLGRYRGFFIGSPRYERLDGSGEPFPTGGLQLVLAVDGTGELTFGGQNASSDRESCAGVSSARCASIGRLLPGFAYRLEKIELLDPKDEPPRIAGEPPLPGVETMSFSVWLGQPWDTWCAGQTLPKASCRSSECAATPAEPAPVVGVAGTGNAGASVCRCGELECRPEASSLSISMRLSEDRLALRGIYEPADAGFGIARLELRREREP
jgi:hypothetical protein